MVKKFLWANVCVQCYTTSNLKDICISGNSEGNQVPCASELRLRMPLKEEETWKKSTVLTSAVKLLTYFGSMFFLLTF